MAAAATYPVHVGASLDAPLSRWPWIFKWVLLIRHYIVPPAAGQAPHQARPPAQPGQPPADHLPARRTTARVVSAVIGAVLLLCSLALLGAGATALWVDTTQREGGYLNLDTTSYYTDGYAVASNTVGVQAVAGGWNAAKALFGTVRLRALSARTTTPLFVGIAPAAAARRYLTGVAYLTVNGTAGHQSAYSWHSGTARAGPPARASIWTVQASGRGQQTLVWPVRNGTWMVVAMNADRSRPVIVQMNVAATIPSLPWMAASALISGVIALAAGASTIAAPTRRASR